MNVPENIFAGGGEIGALMRSFDWGNTPLGIVENWPQSLRTAVSILLNSPFPIFICWGSQFITFYNDNYIPFLAEKHPQALGKPLAEVCPDMWSEIGAMLEKVRETGEATLSENMQLFMHHNKYGKQININFSYAPIRDESNQVEGIFVNCIETSQNVLRQFSINEHELQESQRLLQQIIDTIPGILYIYDLVENRNVYVNQQISDLLGYTPKQIQAMGEMLFPLLVHPDDLVKFPDHIAQFHSLPEGVILELEYRMLRANGEWCWFSGRATVFNRNADGSPRQILGTAYDITKRKQALSELRSQKERFELAAAAVNCLIYDWDLQTNLVQRTDGLTRIFGYLPEEAESTRDWWSSLIHPEDLPKAKEKVIAQLVSQNRYEIEYRVRCKNEQYLYVIDQGFVIKDSEGHPVRVVGTTTNISDRKNLEVALQRSEAKLNDILNSAIAAIISYRVFADGSWESEYFSAGCEKVFGFTVTELTENPHLWMSRVLPEDLAILLPNRYQDIFAARTNSMEYRFQHKDGTWHWISDIMTSRYEPECNCWIATAVATDITERNQLLGDVQLRASQLRGLTEASLAMNSVLSIEQVLQVVTEQARLIIGAHQSITTMAIEGNWRKPIHVVSFSDKYAQWQGYQPNCDICQTYPQIRQMNQVLRMTETELILDPQWMEFNQKMENHPPMRGLLVAPLIRRDGVNIGVIQLSDKYSRDFTEADADILVQLAQMASVAIENSRLYEAEQNARTQAESANRIKDEFLAVLSHELRSPLNPIVGWSKLLRSRKFDQKTTDRALETIERNAKLQTELIEDLLDVSRILQGKLTLNVCSVDLKIIVEAAIETVRLAAEAKSIQIKTLFQANLSLISGDPNRLQQVIWNLLSNAVKFTPNGGKVEIELEQIGGFILIRVSDTGKGINPDFLPYIFDYFRQENSTTTRKFGGLGLGLAIVRHLVELHGGIVQAISPGEGKGATFVVQLPVKSTSSTTKVETINFDLKTNLNGVRALVVEDQTDTRELITTLLEQANARVISVASAQEALKVLTQSEIDILLSDIGMPEVDGYMLLREIRNHSNPKVSQIPAIALTAYVGEFNQRKALQAGFQKHLPKPIEPVELIALVAKLVNNS
ncbi:PAS domain-containing protein [Aerosakkonemataceae cyanobacterium BLCC-F50]|uniref:histidine kinase n=1 Tax=Floridaenema flaviceps BLCC-F50 TaxID=3153642 RepID=A0ABV4XSA1_9CYAN